MTSLFLVWLEVRNQLIGASFEFKCLRNINKNKKIFKVLKKRRMSKELKTCDICRISSTSETQDILIFGDWMHRSNIVTHYYCLLLSTHLCQNGTDASGILGFLVKDIRKVIQDAAQKSCCYCNKKHASISCFTCKTYFHLDCGYRNGCLFKFHDDFRSYCDMCFPLDEQQQEIAKNPPLSWCCAICQGTMSTYKPYNWIYSKCCGNGWVHRVCIQKYALSAGYYLRCIFCKSADYRNLIRQQGIFVPDRDANWEREKGAYSDLHRGYSHCDAEICLCPKGRDYKMKSTTGAWRILLCHLCGSSGTHYGCANKTKVQNDVFKCQVCEQIEHKSNKSQVDIPNTNDQVNPTVYMQKTVANETEETHVNSANPSTTFAEAFQTQGNQSIVMDLNSPLTMPHESTDSPQQLVTEQQYFTQFVDVENTPTQAPLFVNNQESFESDMESSVPDPTQTLEIETERPQPSQSQSQAATYTQLLDIETTNNIQLEEPSSPNQPTQLLDMESLTETQALSQQVCGNPDLSLEAQAVDRELGLTQIQIPDRNDFVNRFHTFEAYKIINDNECLGCVTFCVDRLDERFKGLTTEQIESSSLLDESKDVISQSKDRGIFDIIDEILANETLD